jgi:hypothetical protein
VLKRSADGPEDIAPAVVGEVEADLGAVLELHHPNACYNISHCPAQGIMYRTP